MHSSDEFRDLLITMYTERDIEIGLRGKMPELKPFLDDLMALLARENTQLPLIAVYCFGLELVLRAIDSMLEECPTDSLRKTKIDFQSHVLRSIEAIYNKIGDEHARSLTYIYPKGSC